jgi:hypothetical protein
MGTGNAPEIPILNKTIDRLHLSALDRETTDLIADYNHFDHALFLHAQTLWREGHLPPVERAIITDLAQHSEHGTREIEVTSISLKGDERSLHQIVQGQPWTLLIEGKSSAACDDFTTGLSISDEIGTILYGTNSWLKRHRWTISPDNNFTVEMKFPPMTLATGNYDVTVSFHTSMDGTEKCFHWLEKAFQFEVITQGDQDFVGITNLGARFKLIPDSK